MNWLLNYLKGHTAITHAFLVSLLALAGGSQLPMGQSILHTITTNHPRIAPLITTFIGIGFLLLNPSVDAKIKSATGIDLTVDEAKLQQSKQNITEVQQDLAQAKAQAAQAVGQPPTAPPGGPVKS
jgi:hypothetical protein